MTLVAGLLLIVLGLGLAALALVLQHRVECRREPGNAPRLRQLLDMRYIGVSLSLAGILLAAGSAIRS